MPSEQTKTIRPEDQPSFGVRTATWMTTAAVLWVVGYGIWFISMEYQAVGAPVLRLEILLNLPEILLANIFSIPGVESGSWSNLVQRLDLIVIAVLVWLTAWLAGRAILRIIRCGENDDSLECNVFALGLGLSSISLFALAFGLLGVMSAWWFAGLAAGSVVAQIIRWRSPAELNPPPDAPGRLLHPRRRIAMTIAVASPFLLAMLLGSLLPPTDFDVKTYHLTGPKEYFLLGRISFLPHNVYTSFPFLTEMLSLVGMELRQDWWRGALAGQCILMGFAPLTALAIYCLGRRLFAVAPAWWAATIYLTTPWTYRLAVIAYVEGALSCFLTLSLLALAAACERNRQPATAHPSAAQGLFLIAGFFAGSAMACKYTGLVAVVIPIGLAVMAVSFRRHRAATFYFAGGILVAIGPWLGKNIVETGNPVYPLAYGIFGGADWDAAMNERWTSAHRPQNYEPLELMRSIVDVTGRSNWLSPLLYGFAPLCTFPLLVKRREHSPEDLFEKQTIRLLALYAVYLFATWWFLTHRLDRFWVPMLPIVALLAGRGATWSDSRSWVIFRNGCFLICLLFNLGFITTSLCGFNAYLGDLDALRSQSEHSAEDIHYLNRLYREKTILPGANVLCVGQAQVFDAAMPVLYSTAFDQPPLFQFLSADLGSTFDSQISLSDPVSTLKALRDAGVTHVVVNWEAILKYRVTYGYSEAITPKLFEQMQETGVLGDPTQLPEGVRFYDSLSDFEQRELESWAPQLKDQDGERQIYIAWQIFPVTQSLRD